jgi:pentatricopeptide repeat protein
MDVSLENLKHGLEPKWAHFGRRKNLETAERVYEMMNSENFRHTSDAPMSKV